MDEKMKILKMLENGAISADEAVQLLAATDRGRDDRREARQDQRQEAREERDDWRAERGGGQQYGYDGRRTGFDDFAGEMRRKFGALMRDMEPKIQKLTETVVKQTASAADALAKTIDEHRRDHWRADHGGAPGKPEAEPGHKHGGTQEKAFELPVSREGAELNIAGLNGSVTVRGYNGATISLKVRYTPRHGAEPDFAAFGDKYMLTWDDGDFRMIAVDAYVPQAAFDAIFLSTDNGALALSGVNARQVRLESSNGAVDIGAINAGQIIVESTNGALTIRDIVAEQAGFEGFNGAIRAEDVDVRELRLTTFNAAVTVRAAKLERFDDYLWQLESGNAKLSATLPTGGLGYHIKAHAALSDVRVNLNDLRFLQNDRFTVEAATHNFEGCPRKMRLSAETSNGSLVIN